MLLCCGGRGGRSLLARSDWASIAVIVVLRKGHSLVATRDCLSMTAGIYLGTINGSEPRRIRLDGQQVCMLYNSLHLMNKLSRKCMQTQNLQRAGPNSEVGLESHGAYVLVLRPKTGGIQKAGFAESFCLCGLLGSYALAFNLRAPQSASIFAVCVLAVQHSGAWALS